MKLSYTYWQNDGFYIGHLNEYPEYDTQGKSLTELESMLKSLYEDCQPIPRHSEINEYLAKSIIKKLL
jgi:predicted RNase H-like HicB family nuclease